MPITRYEIRNEYSLADPDLYRAPDKDDPEALLEGVAMAGLVGLLRQLGDLAELVRSWVGSCDIDVISRSSRFAAEIFHNLHEDVMATASRGHAIAFRVQQLETELPSIERAYLSQTDHSPFFYHPGVDWHPNLRLDNNLVTQGDMPRFIMDSYEECRAPPRLFLLDKFDIAGAGACLKRYTDPSFFKLETSEMTSADIQKEKKVRKAKAKKKGPRWRNRETHEVVPTSHTKLHQLFLEERVENGISIASERAKLKRRLNGFPFNSKAGESYMEKILKSPSPDHNMLHGMTVDSPQLKLATNDHNDYASEVFEIRPVSPYRERGRKRSTPSSPDRESVAHNPPTYDSDESLVDDEICEILTSHPRIATNGISSALDKGTGVKVAAVDSESNKQGSFTDNESDDMVSEIDNFVDAPSTMESEMDRDSDMRMKRDETLPIKLEELVTDAYEEPLHSRSSGSQSTGESTMSDVGNNSSAKEISSFSFDTPSILAEKPHSESSSTKGFQCADISVNEIVDKSSYQDTADEDFPDHHSKPVDSDDTCTETDAFTKHRSSLMHSDLDVLTRKYTLRPPESDEKVSTVDDTDRSIGPQCVVFHGTCAATAEQVTSTLCMNGSMPALELSDPQEVVGDHELEAPRSAEMVSLTDDKEKMMNLVIIPPSFHSGCISGSQSEDHLSRSSNGDQLVDGANDESIPCFSSVHDIYHHTSDSLARSSGLLHDDKSDGENWDLVNDAASTLNIPSLPSVLSTNGTLDMISSGNRFQDKFEDEFPEVPEYTPPDYPDGECNGDDIEPERNSLENEWDDEDSNVATDSLNRSPCIMDASLEKGLEETLFTSACTLPLEDNHFNSSFENEISLEDLKLSHLANSPDSPMEGLDAHNEDVIPEEDTTINETLPLGTPEPFEVVGIQVRGTSYHVSPNDSEAVEISHCASENLEKPAGTSDTVEMDGIPESSGSNAKEFTEITSSADLQSANEIHVLLNKSVSEFDTSNTMGITVPVPEASDGASLSKLVEEHNDKNCPSEGESNHVEEVVPTEASASSFRTIICNSVNSDHPKLELSGSVPNSHLDLELDHSQEVIHAAIIQSPTEQFGHDREQELFNKFDLENHVPDAPSFPIDNATEESVQFGLLPPDLDQHVPHSSGTSAELSPSSPMINLQTLDNDDGKGESNSMSAFSHVKCSNQPSITELVRLRNNEINVSGYPKDPLLSISPPSNPFLEANQINLSDLPPLPPLPPVQWRMGKLLNALPSAEEEMIRNEESFPQLISPSAATDDVGSTLSTEHTHDGSSPPSAPTDDIISLHEMKGSSTEVAGETISKEENLENRCSSFEAKTLHETTDHPSKMENKPQLLATPISETVSTTPAAEDVAENGSQKVKLFRPHNALVDDISFLDKSKLRKVTERIRPEIQKVDERDSLLQQIRTKSFNLRPAMASRPSIRARGPDTNLKVVAILEKANAIRQAFAGSDEDDNDSWSE